MDVTDTVVGVAKGSAWIAASLGYLYLVARLACMAYFKCKFDYTINVVLATSVPQEPRLPE